MQQHVTLQYWHEGEELVGRLKELPGLVVRGRDLDEVESRMADACRAMATLESRAAQADMKQKSMIVEVMFAPAGD
jgi:hypothetical protein